jgi:hypothetical protein
MVLDIPTELTLLPTFELVSMPRCVCGAVIKSFTSYGNPINPVMINIRMKNHLQSKTHRDFCARKNIPVPPVEPIIYMTPCEVRRYSQPDYDNNVGRFVCECGSNIKDEPKNIQKHKKTVKHRVYIRTRDYRRDHPEYKEEDEFKVNE